MRTIANLLNLDGRVYVYVPSKNIRRLFLKNAQEEGFMLNFSAKSYMNADSMHNYAWDYSCYVHRDLR